MNLAGDCTDASPCSVHPFLQFSSPFLLVSTLPSSLPISDEHQQLWNGPAPPPHLSLSHCAPSSAPAPAPGTLSCPTVAVPWFSSLHLPLQFLCLIHCTISSVPTTAVAPRTYRSITTVVLGPTNPEGVPQPLTHWYPSDAAPSPPSCWAVVWGQGEEVSEVSSMATNPTSWGSPNPALAAQSQVWLMLSVRQG